MSGFYLSYLDAGLAAGEPLHRLLDVDDKVLRAFIFVKLLDFSDILNKQGDTLLEKKSFHCNYSIIKITYFIGR